MRKPLLVKHAEIDRSLKEEKRGLRKVVVPEMYSKGEVILLARRWTALIKGDKPVVESATMQFSYFNERAEQKPHWHEQQVEIYTVLRGQLDVLLLDVDNDSDFESCDSVDGSILIPPRFCHLVRAKDENLLVQVLQFAVGKGPIKDDQQVCEPRPGRKCPRSAECKLAEHYKKLPTT